MTSLTIDFRGSNLRILIMKDKAVHAAKVIRDLPDHFSPVLKDRLSAVLREAGWKKGTVTVILPTGVVKHRVYSLPFMSREDTEKVAERELKRDIADQDIIFGIRQVQISGQEKSSGQDIIAEYALQDDIRKYCDLLKACGLRPEVITSSLEGTTHLFNRFRPETEGIEAVVDIGRDMIELAAFQNTHLSAYERIPISKVSDESDGADDQSSLRADKMKLFRIVDALYNVAVESRQHIPEAKLSRLWICGIGSELEGIADAISGGLGIPAEVLHPSGMDFKESSTFSAVAGASLISRKELFVNLIPDEILHERAIFYKRLLLAASLPVYALLIIGGSFMLNRTENDLQQSLTDNRRAVQLIQDSREPTPDIYASAQETLAGLAAHNPDFYRVFRDIANLTPYGVVLHKLEVGTAGTITTLRISANIPYSDETFRKAVLSRFMHSLDSSSVLARSFPPEIATETTTGTAQKTMRVLLTYEVGQ